MTAVEVDRPAAEVFAYATDAGRANLARLKDRLETGTAAEPGST